MKKLTWAKKVVLLSLPLVMVMITIGGGVGAQETTEKKERAKPRGRLPNYFAAVVDEAQREEIYSIQAKYAQQIEDLQQQLEELKATRDQEVEDVLTPEQLEKVNAKRAEAAAKRKARLEAAKKEKEAAAAKESSE